jgi:hypothetical protein
MLSIDPLGTLDLNDNDFIAGGVSFSTVKTWVLDGYSSSPDATRHGIISTTGKNSGNTMLMLFDNSLIGVSEWPAGTGNSAPANAICGKYTYFGDTNLDGQVTAADYNAVDAALGLGVENPLGAMSQFALPGQRNALDSSAITDLVKSSDDPIA